MLLVVDAKQTKTLLQKKRSNDMTALQLLNIKYVNPIRADKLCSNRKVDRVKKCRNSQLEAIKKGTFGCNA